MKSLFAISGIILGGIPIYTSILFDNASLIITSILLIIEVTGLLESKSFVPAIKNKMLGDKLMTSFWNLTSISVDVLPLIPLLCISKSWVVLSLLTQLSLGLTPYPNIKLSPKNTYLFFIINSLLKIIY